MNNPRFEQIVEITPAFDRRHPDPKQNYGIHGVEMHFVLKGAAGAVHFLLYTNWQLPHVTRESMERIMRQAHDGELQEVSLRVCFLPMPMDRGYHSPNAMYEGQESRECSYLDGKPCYYDGSSLNAAIVFKAMLEEGSTGLWRELEYYYHDVFEVPLMQRTIQGAEMGLMIEGIFGTLRSANAVNPQPENEGTEERRPKDQEEENK